MTAVLGAGRSRRGWTYDRPIGGSLATMALFSALGSIVCALLFVLVQNATLPPTDLAAGSSFVETLSDPFVQWIGGWVTGLSAMVVYFAALHLLRGRRLWPTFAITFAATVLEILVMTPRGGPLGWFVSLSAAAATMIACRSVPNLAADAEAA